MTAERVALDAFEFGAICDAVSPLLQPSRRGALELDHAITPVVEEIIAARVAAAKVDAMREMARELWNRYPPTVGGEE